MKSITIAGQSFEISEPYEAGHPLTDIEAKRLNQLRGENIANNMRKAVKEAVESGNLNQITKEIADYDATYEFTAVSAGGARRMDPEEREARSLEAFLLARLLLGATAAETPPPAHEGRAAEVLAEIRPELLPERFREEARALRKGVVHRPPEGQNPP